MIKDSTGNLHDAMQEPIKEVYREIFPGYKRIPVEQMWGRDQGAWLDRHFGIDAAIERGGHFYTVQEKVRDNSCLTQPYKQEIKGYPDITVEHKNNYGTTYETDGEYFYLGSQLYFVGWANRERTELERWLLLDVAKYKQITSRGMHNLGTWRQNYAHSKASFYSISVQKFAHAVLKGSEPHGWWR